MRERHRVPALSQMTAPSEMHASPRVAARAARPGGRRRRVLLLCPEAPAPPTWGFALRVYHLGRLLAQRHDVTLLTYDTGDPTRDWDHLAQLFEVRRVPAPDALRSKRRSQLRALASRRSHHLSSLLSPAMQHALDETVAAENFDVIQVESSRLAGLSFPDGPALVLDEHNVEHDLLRRVAASERSLPRRFYQRIEERRVRREEAVAWRRASGCAITSVPDQCMVRAAAPGTPTRVVPNGVDLDYFVPGLADPDPDSIAFVGSINYRPNTDAVRYFAERILPLIQRERPDATLSVVGAGVPDSLRGLESARVRFLGGVDDIRPHLARTAVIAVPLRMGGGTRIKVLDGLAMGKATVSTSLGCEGIDAVDGRHLLVADDPRSFASAVIRLLGDSHLRRALGSAGRALVERSYGWEMAATELEGFHDLLTGVAGREAATDGRESA